MKRKSNKTGTTANGNKRTRPVRRNAGKRQSHPGYVTTDLIPVESDTSFEPSDDEDRRGRGRKKRRVKSPKLKSLSPVESVLSSVPSSRSSSPSPIRPLANASDITLVVNTPPDHNGQIVIKLDLDSILKASTVKPQLQLPTPTSRSQSFQPKQRAGASPSKKPVGFCSIPGELRNQIYRIAFLGETRNKHRFNIRDPWTFSRSAAVLRTCKQVHSEACDILYGEVTFEFDRQTRLRGTMYSQWAEVGYKDVRRFLRNIGPRNVSLMRDVSLVLEDSPSVNSRGPSGEEMRYTHDDDLLDCLRLLGQAGQLQRLEVTFAGKRMVTRCDERFVRYAKRIKADKVEFPRYRDANRHYSLYPGRNNSKIDEPTRNYLKERMERKEKLYGPPK